MNNGIIARLYLCIAASFRRARVIPAQAGIHNGITNPGKYSHKYP